VELALLVELITLFIVNIAQRKLTVNNILSIINKILLTLDNFLANSKGSKGEGSKG
jgi:hypothetical protein